MAGILFASLLVVPIVVSQIRVTQIDNTEKSDQRDETLLAIQDCTQPAGKCFKRGQRRTAQAVAQLLTGNVNALACAMQVPEGTSVDDTVAMIRDCLVRLDR